MQSPFVTVFLNLDETDEYAQEVADKLCELGVKGIWNFSYMELRAKDGIEIENVHLSDSLMTLSHTIAERE